MGNLNGYTLGNLRVYTPNNFWYWEMDSSPSLIRAYDVKTCPVRDNQFKSAKDIWHVYEDSFNM